MNVSSMLSSRAASATQSKLTNSAQTAAATAVGGGPANPASAQANAAMRSILAQYDVSNITPTQFSEMVQKLQAAGAISPQDAKNLAAVRADLDKANVDPAQSLNLVDFYRQQVKKSQQQFDADPTAANGAPIQPLQQRLAWMEKFSAGHSHPEEVGLNAEA